MKAVTKKALKQLDPDFDTRPKSVQNKMGRAIDEFDAEIMKVGDGIQRIVFPQDTAGRSLGRLSFVNSFARGRSISKADREASQDMPWELFEDDEKKREALKSRVGLKVATPLKSSSHPQALDNVLARTREKRRHGEI